MRAAVLIPYRAGCPHRARALEHIQRRYLAAHPGVEVLLGACEGGSWVKARAVRDALERTTARVLVIADADVWSDGLAAAIREVHGGAAWAIPHRSVHRLTDASTRRHIAGEPLEDLQLHERPYRGVEGGGIVVVARDVYEGCPLDPRFEGWGGEDDAWGMALRALHGAPWRPREYAPLVHLWHPPQQRATRSCGSEPSRELRKRYARARHDPDAMRRLIEEARP